MKIVIGGCRNYNNYNVFKAFIDEILKNKEYPITILSGHCLGVDTMAEQYANQNGFELEIFPAEWKEYGRAAGPLRNKKMVEQCDMVIAFWDSKSKGTQSLISYAKANNKTVIIKYIS